jgi:sarcosine oxidase subunit alpha
MKEIEVLVIGGGPAGLCAAINAAELGAKVLMCERDDVPGGQLVKQTHKFFGSEKQYAGDRGYQIGEMLVKKCMDNPNIEVWTNTTVMGYYEDGVVTCEHEDKHVKIKPEAVVICTGAAEKFLSFPGNDLPGIYGAGAVQTLMNVSGVKPADKVLVVGAGNIGLIVSYQLLQAGVDVVAIVEAAPKIGGYKVHASKVRRMGVPIYTKTTCKTALGTDKVTGAVLADMDDKFQIVPGTEREIEVDTICLAVGLSPLSELIQRTGAKMYYIPQLGGFVPERDENLETTAEGVYIAGDVSCIEEATAAMIEGNIAGLSAAIATGMNHPETVGLRNEWIEQLKNLRSGKTGAKIRSGLEIMHGGQ